MYHFMLAFTVLTLFSKYLLSAGFITHGLTSRKLPCRGLPDMTLDGGKIDHLEDNSYDTCITPLSYGSRLGKFTLEIFNITQTSLEIVTAISLEASCYPPEVVLAAETTNKDIVECILVDVDDTTGKFRMCRHACFCNDCCLYVHVHFNSLRASRLQNTQWQLCDIQVCYDWHIMAWTKWPPCCKWYFWIQFLERLFSSLYAQFIPTDPNDTNSAQATNHYLIQWWLILLMSSSILLVNYNTSWGRGGSNHIFLIWEIMCLLLTALELLLPIYRCIVRYFISSSDFLKCIYINMTPHEDHGISNRRQTDSFS